MADVLNEGIRLFQKAQADKTTAIVPVLVQPVRKPAPSSTAAQRRAAASELAHRRWEKVPASERAEIARRVSRARWAKKDRSDEVA